MDIITLAFVYWMPALHTYYSSGMNSIRSFIQHSLMHKTCFFFPPQKSAPFFGSPRYRRCLIKCLLCECAASRMDMLCVRDAALGCNQWLRTAIAFLWPPTSLPFLTTDPWNQSGIFPTQLLLIGYLKMFFLLFSSNPRDGCMNKNPSRWAVWK